MATSNIVTLKNGNCVTNHLSTPKVIVGHSSSLSSSISILVKDENNSTHIEAKYDPQSKEQSSQIPLVEVDYSKLEHFEFKQPPECPIFRPNEEEFALGPIEYISRIREKAEPFGICKIIPPKSFKVPFAIDQSIFHFTPRIQRINDLEAFSRLRLNFADRLSKFWHYQGIKLRVPTIEKKYLDVYQFHNIVKAEGGFEICIRERKWGKIAVQMGYSRHNSTALKLYYEKVLFPYDVFLSGATINHHIEVIRQIHRKNSIILRLRLFFFDFFQKPLTPIKAKNDCDGSVIKIEQDLDSNETKIEPNSDDKIKLKSDENGDKLSEEDDFEFDYPPKDRYCSNCSLNNQSYSLLTCRQCRHSFHKTCLIPPFNDVPRGDWHCHSCLSKILEKSPKTYTSEFGFVQSPKTYTLEKFGQMADEFKSSYFKCPTSNVSLSDLEKEFWRIVSTPFENVVCVEYGADLYTNDYGSGFPTQKNSSSLSDNKIKEYINSPWNLNNLPTLSDSVFEHINTNINGMIIPWMYVGMCFSAFCWHNEDHWTYSINYLHWGEPKSWYGVPGDKAEIFEDSMRNLAPELFSQQPDLLHHLVTTCNPNLLIDQGVPIYRVDQKAGEFVVTFPRSYHAGFNQGFNFAEAVNFATADWLPIGRLSISHYSMFHRYPVFSHDELICKMADGCKDLSKRLALATLDDFKDMVKQEFRLRQKIFALGIVETEYFSFESLKDDERQCDYCKTTCFLSAIKCHCKGIDFIFII
ncbi:lysine-specific demethylase 5A-like protein [Sarcoptes scabiei]|uniref:[histone H3]-trimethyl-L-lysine(4) demethylase n=1 Tax=Sarcoptes scabiei TaxID=52283 RepID=A0A132A4R6_SARSC|nr:lysine-specific demethylase 5A-like protein [Sarcoptes scabiei]